MQGTGYRIIHTLTGRKVIITCLGYRHDRKKQKQMLEYVAKIERQPPQMYRIDDSPMHEFEFSFVPDSEPGIARQFQQPKEIQKWQRKKPAGKK